MMNEELGFGLNASNEPIICKAFEVLVALLILAHCDITAEDLSGDNTKNKEFFHE